MYYELYIDSLLLINFVMNLYLLELVNRSMLRTATRRRILGGAALGAVLYLLSFLIPGPGWLKLILGVLLSALGMIVVTFRTKSLKGLLQAAEKLVMYSFLLGGCLLFLIQCFPGIRRYLTSVLGILGLGGLLFMEILRLLERRKHQDICRVTLVVKGARIAVNALLDSGNGLVEPISGKPVSILEKNVFESLWKDNKPEFYRAVPYHSIGKKRGILRGYQIPELQIEVEGAVKVCRDVYVGIGEDELTCGEHYRMILNPALLEEVGELCRKEGLSHGN